MSRTGSRAVRRVVPEHEKRCVWMTAGILSYRICSRDHDCATCPLDQALRLRCGTRPGGGLDPLPPLHMLHRGHVWIHVEDDGTVVAGLDDFAQRLVGPVTWVDLPAPGGRVERGRPAFRVSHGAVETDVVSPVTGRVTSVNEALRENPNRINRSPYDAGWVLRLRADDLADDVPHLLFGQPVDPWLCEETRALEQELAAALGLDPAAGDAPRLADGGAVPSEFLTGLTPERRSRILDRFLRRPRQDAHDPRKGDRP